MVTDAVEEVPVPSCDLPAPSPPGTAAALAPDGASAEQERLRAAVRALRQPQAAHRAPAPRSSIWVRAAAAVPADTHPPAPRALLEPRFRNAETSALLPGTTLVLLLVPDEGALAPSLARSAGLCATAGSDVVVLGPQLPRDVSRTPGRPVCVPLRRDDPVTGEWALIACGPARRVAFLARPEPGGDAWSWTLTRDGVAVHRAACAVLERVPFLRLRVPSLTA